MDVFNYTYAALALLPNDVYQTSPQVPTATRSGGDEWARANIAFGRMVAPAVAEAGASCAASDVYGTAACPFTAVAIPVRASSAACQKAKRCRR